MTAHEMTVSCLCVTERRLAFMPWLLWNFDRQIYAQKELVIVDSSPEPFRSDRDDVRVVVAPPGTNVPAKRNLALEAVRGSAVAWFDDDDWQHPERLTRLVRALEEGHDYAGTSHAWFLDVHTGACHSYNGHRALIFNGAGFRADLATGVRFDEKVHKASDTVWLRQISSKKRRFCHLEDILTFWLCHEENLSNPRGRRRFPSILDEIKKDVGAAAWGDTDTRLVALRDALPPPGTQLTLRHASDDAPDDEGPSIGRRAYLRRTLPRRAWSEPRSEVTDEAGRPTAPRASRRSNDVAAAPPPPPSEEAPTRIPGLPDVSFVLLASPDEVAHLETSAVHVQRQARFCFAERTLLIVPSEDAATEEAVGVGKQFVESGHFDAIFEAPAAAVARETVAEYRAPGSGGAEWVLPPSTAIELSAIHRAKTDHVFFCRPGVFFHASGVSWVEEALLRMRADASLWTMSTHAGPPAGPVGHPRSLPAGSLGHLQWDRRLRLWRSRTVGSRYFLVDRRRLRGALPPSVNAPESLGAWLSQPASRGERVHGGLALKGSWAVGTDLARIARADWVGSLAELVQRGLHPACQRGRFDLSFAEPRSLDAWRRLVVEHAPRPKAA